MVSRKVLVYGCSVSACSEGKCISRERVYSKYLADKLNVVHENYAIGCGSNDRIFRLFTKHFLEGEITSNDLVVIQYTTPERKEFWSKHFLGDASLREKYGLGQTIRYKIDINGDTRSEDKFFKLYEKNFINQEFEVEILKGIHASILALAKLKNVTILFLEAYPTHMEFNPIKIPKLLDYTNAYYLDITNTFKIDKCVQVFEDGTFDRYHLNPEGHKVVADLIYNKLMKTKAV